MSEDTFTEVTEESWLSRIGGAIKGIAVGLVLFIAAFPVLFWNEGRAVREFKTLNEGAGGVIPLTEAMVSSDNEGRLVHVTGRAETAEILVDPEFSVAANAIRLLRTVEMYQWKEKKRPWTISSKPPIWAMKKRGPWSIKSNPTQSEPDGMRILPALSSQVWPLPADNILKSF